MTGTEGKGGGRDRGRDRGDGKEKFVTKGIEGREVGHDLYHGVSEQPASLEVNELQVYLVGNPVEVVGANLNDLAMADLVVGPFLENPATVLRPDPVLALAPAPALVP
eukprot:TRINITY_DN10667_c0_g1_i1.p3 TRINITY_DN10667_c0_g1~~TRINITY_DN10667_c0_g1_i1.p3  ORF type:complete len:108 (+),score=20.54 TRINITY_DN10667_c0_g1_i1:436-759(+)